MHVAPVPLHSSLLLADGASPMPDLLGSPLLLVAMFGVFYFIVFRPERKRQALREERVNKLQRGDEVALKAGILGKIDGVNEDGSYTVEIADRVKVRVVKGGIDDKLETKAPTTSAGTGKP